LADLAVLAVLAVLAASAANPTVSLSIRGSWAHANEQDELKWLPRQRDSLQPFMLVSRRAVQHTGAGGSCVGKTCRASVGHGERAWTENHRSNSHVLVKEWKREAYFLARALAGASPSRRQAGDPWYRSLFGGQDLRANARLHTACELQAEEARSLHCPVSSAEMGVFVSCGAVLAVASLQCEARNWHLPRLTTGSRHDAAGCLVHVTHCLRAGRH
jgi:hypothetical protein